MAKDKEEITEKTGNIFTEEKKIRLGAFLANSQYVRKYNSYLQVGFRKVADDSVLMTESEWEKLFVQYATKKIN